MARPMCLPFGIFHVKVVHEDTVQCCLVTFGSVIGKHWVPWNRIAQKRRHLGIESLLELWVLDDSQRLNLHICFPCLTHHLVEMGLGVPGCHKGWVGLLHCSQVCRGKGRLGEN